MAVSRWIDVTIANGAAVSEAVYLKPEEGVIGILTPAAWTAADIRIQVSRDGATFFDVRDSAGTIIKPFTSLPTAAQEFFLATDLLAAGATNSIRGIPFDVIKLRSVNTASDADVNQAADRTISILVGDCD